MTPHQITNLLSLVFYLIEIRRRGSKDLLKVCVIMETSEGAVEEGQPVPSQIYDVPYEGGGDGDKTTLPRPEIDPRPSAEYELPWERKKEQIVKTLSGTSDVGSTTKLIADTIMSEHWHQSRECEREKMSSEIRKLLYTLMF